jgi:hypothetical protein
MKMTDKKYVDFFGQTLYIGDTVAFYAPGYRQFCQGTVIAFTPKKVRVEYLNNWNFGNPGLRCEYLADSDMFIKRNIEELEKLRQQNSDYSWQVNPERMGA